jgi:TRAP transporter TAXI family solute receptor
MEHHKDRQNVGASIPIPAIIATLVTVAILAGGIFTFYKVSTDTVHPSVVVATGPESGVYHALGTSLKRVLEGTGYFDSIILQATDGSAENMRLVGEQDPDIDLAFVQGDAFPSNNARLITVLYDEVLHILVRRDLAEDIRTIYDLEGKRVALGPAGSGTRDLSHRVLRHFGIELAEDLMLPPQEAARGLVDASLDAAFMLTAIPSRLIGDLAARDAIRFISLGDARAVGDEAHALELVYPGMKNDTIPRSTYVRLPEKAVHTVSVAGLLVAHKDLDEELVRSVTEAIFGNRSGPSGLEGTNLLVARKIRENYNPGGVTLAYHPGSAAYYRREEPPFFVEYAEALSFGLTLLLAIYSVSIAVREWVRRKMKNRVDAYLMEVERLAADSEQLDPQGLHQRYREIEQLRRDAFSDLVAERLLADEAFIILQNHLRDELAAIQIQLRGVPGEDSAG